MPTFTDLLVILSILSEAVLLELLEHDSNIIIDTIKIIFFIIMISS